MAAVAASKAAAAGVAAWQKQAEKLAAELAVGDEPVDGLDSFILAGSAAPAAEDEEEAGAAAPTVLPHFSQRAALPPLSAFADSPLLLTGDPRVPGQLLNGSADPATVVPLDDVVSIETDVFVGRAVCNFKGLGDSAAAFRDNPRWLGRTVIQGVFKQETRAEDLWVGQELWNRPLMPASFQRLVFSTAAKMFSSTARVRTEGDGVGFLNPLLAVANVVHVAPPGAAPEIGGGGADGGGALVEDARLLCAALADKRGRPLPAAQRQRHFDRPANLAGVAFRPGLVHTFVVAQGIMSLPAYRLALGGPLNLDLAPLLNGQPLQLMCKDVSTGRTVMSLLAWHRNLNYAGSGGGGGGGAASGVGGRLASMLRPSASCGSLPGMGGGAAGVRCSVPGGGMHSRCRSMGSLGLAGWGSVALPAAPASLATSSVSSATSAGCSTATAATLSTAGPTSSSGADVSSVDLAPCRHSSSSCSSSGEEDGAASVATTSDDATSAPSATTGGGSSGCSSTSSSSSSSSSNSSTAAAAAIAIDDDDDDDASECSWASCASELLDDDGGDDGDDSCEACALPVDGSSASVSTPAAEGPLPLSTSTTTTTASSSTKKNKKESFKGRVRHALKAARSSLSGRHSSAGSGRLLLGSGASATAGNGRCP